MELPRSGQSGSKYSELVEIPSDNSGPECTAFKYLSYKSCSFLIKQTHIPPQLNKLDYMVGILVIPKYMECVSDNSPWAAGGGGHQTS